MAQPLHKLTVHDRVSWLVDEFTELEEAETEEDHADEFLDCAMLLFSLQHASLNSDQFMVVARIEQNLLRVAEAKETVFGRNWFIIPLAKWIGKQVARGRDCDAQLVSQFIGWLAGPKIVFTRGF